MRLLLTDLLFALCLRVVPIWNKYMTASASRLYVPTFSNQRHQDQRKSTHIRLWKKLHVCLKVTFKQSHLWLLSLCKKKKKKVSSLEWCSVEDIVQHDLPVSSRPADDHEMQEEETLLVSQSASIRRKSEMFTWHWRKCQRSRCWSAE